MIAPVYTKPFGRGWEICRIKLFKEVSHQSLSDYKANQTDFRSCILQGLWHNRLVQKIYCTNKLQPTKIVQNEGKRIPRVPYYLIYSVFNQKKNYET